MGLLEDAIREHLELRRRHGAAEEDLRRQEAEALGPARNEVAKPATEDAEDAAASVEGDGAAEPEKVEAGDAPTEHLAAAEPSLPFDHELTTVQPPVDTEPEPTRLAAPEPAPEPEPEPASEPEPAREPIGEEDDTFAGDEPFAEEPAAEEKEGEQPAKDEDVLEETPDFLQETPEHDRLWFEQKPPRDFDFD